MTTDLYDLDIGIEHCEGCGCLTASGCGLCSRCIAEVDDDLDWHRNEGHADPNGVRS